MASSSSSGDGTPDQALFPWRRNPLPLDTGRSASLSVLTAPEIRPGVAGLSRQQAFLNEVLLPCVQPSFPGTGVSTKEPLIVTCVSDFIQVAAQPD